MIELDNVALSSLCDENDFQFHQRESKMSATLIGDTSWLKGVCGRDIRMSEWDMNLLSGDEAFACDVVEKSDAVIVVTDHISHAARRNILSAASKQKVPVFMRHSCGANLFQECLASVKQSVGMRTPSILGSTHFPSS